MGDESILSGRRDGRLSTANARSRVGSPRRGGGRTRCGSRRGTRRGRRRGPIPRTLCRMCGTIPQQCIAPGEGTKSRRRRETRSRAASIAARPAPGRSTGSDAPLTLANMARRNLMVTSGVDSTTAARVCKCGGRVSRSTDGAIAMADLVELAACKTLAISGALAIEQLLRSRRLKRGCDTPRSAKAAQHCTRASLWSSAAAARRACLCSEESDGPQKQRRGTPPAPRAP